MQGEDAAESSVEDIEFEWPSITQVDLPIRKIGFAELGLRKVF